MAEQQALCEDANCAAAALRSKKKVSVASGQPTEVLVIRGGGMLRVVRPLPGCGVRVCLCLCLSVRARARARAHVRARFCCVRPVCGVCVPARVRACLRLCLRACACVCACVRVCAASARTKSCACLKEARPPLDADKDADAYWEDEDGRIKKKMQVRARARACALVLLHRVVCCWVRVCCAPVRRHELCGRGSLSPPGGRPLRVCCVQGETRVCAARLLCRSGTECSDLQQKCTVQNRCSYCVEQCFLFQNSLV